MQCPRGGGLKKVKKRKTLHQKKKNLTLNAFRVLFLSQEQH